MTLPQGPLLTFSDNNITSVTSDDLQMTFKCLRFGLQWCEFHDYPSAAHGYEYESLDLDDTLLLN